jgi:ribose transport system permease protein
MKEESINLALGHSSMKEKLKASAVIKTFIAMFALYIFSIILAPNYLALDHINQTIALASFLGIIAIGQTLVILTGGLDLSIAYTMNFGAVILTQETLKLGGFPALIIALATGVIIGLFNGFFIAYIGISPMIMTLATNSILKSVTYVYTGGTPKGVASQWICFIGSGSIFGVRAAILFWALISVMVVILLLKTTFGRKVISIGNSYKTSYLSGINNNRVIMGVYALSGLFAVVAGIMLTGLSQGRAYLGMGDSFQIASIAAVVIGGTSIIGGKGGYVGTIAGAIIIYILNSILAVLNMADAGRQIIFGLVIFVVLLIYGREKKIRA